MEWLVLLKIESKGTVVVAWRGIVNNDSSKNRVECGYVGEVGKVGRILKVVVVYTVVIVKKKS